MLPSSIHYDEIVHNNEDLMVARIICMKLIIVIKQYVHVTAFTMYSIELFYALLGFYNHVVTNDLHNFHTLRQISHEINYINCGMKIYMNSYLTHIE